MGFDFGFQVAPNQYEFAPMFGNVIGQIDNNLMVMQICEEVCAKHGLVALMQEKPFANINGSGKHNNWSLSTMEGAQLFNPTNLTCALLSPPFALALANWRGWSKSSGLCVVRKGLGQVFPLYSAHHN